MSPKSNESTNSSDDVGEQVLDPRNDQVAQLNSKKQTERKDGEDQSDFTNPNRTGERSNERAKDEFDPVNENQAPAHTEMYENAEPDKSSKSYFEQGKSNAVKGILEKVEATLGFSTGGEKETAEERATRGGIEGINAASSVEEPENHGIEV